MKINRKKLINKPIQYNNVQISIDTMVLVASLTDEQKEELYDRITFYKNNDFQDKYFNYTQKINNITVKTTPKFPLTNATYNTMIIFQRDTTSMYIPYSILELLQFDTWQIKRLDVAFDFATPFENRLIMKHHGNVKLIQQGTNEKDWNTEYLHKLNAKTETKVALYDRNKKEAYRDTEIEHDYPTRFEVRLWHKLDEYNHLNRVDHGWIESKLSKYIFIPDIEQLPISKWDKRKLYAIQQDYDYSKTLDKKKQQELKEIIKTNRVPFEQIYEANKHDLFSFLELEQLPKYETFYDNMVNNGEDILNKFDFDEFKRKIDIHNISDKALEQLLS